VKWVNEYVKRERKQRTKNVLKANNIILGPFKSNELLPASVESLRRN